MFLSTLSATLTLDERDEYAFYNKALVFIELGLHRHNFGDMAAVLEYLHMAAALDINPDGKDALHMKVLLTHPMLWAIAQPFSLITDTVFL